VLADKRIENDRMSDDLLSRINSLQMKQYRLRADRDFEIKQAKEDAQVVFDQAKLVQTKMLPTRGSQMPSGWRVIEPPKNQNTNNKRIIRERPPAAVFDPDDPRSYSNLVGDGADALRPRTGKRRRPKTPRRPRPNTAVATSIVSPTEQAEPEPKPETEQATDQVIEDAIAATAEANVPEPEPVVTPEIEEPLRFSNFIGFIRPKTADSNRRPRGGFGDPNADYRYDRGKSTPHPGLPSQVPPPQNIGRPQTAGNPRRPRTAHSASRPQSRADESSGGQSYKDLKSQNHIDFASVAMKNNKKESFIKKREEMQANESARLQVRMKAFYESLEDFKIKAAQMKKHQVY
jgi:hypothetical protein